MNRLKLKGLDNGRLYRQVAIAYDLCFTKDAGFVHNVRQTRESSQVKLLHVMIPQQRVEPFVAAFVELSKARIGPAIPMAMIGRN